ncbi:MAG: Clp protease N-terminal domain-containing protein, partial [Pirellulales bacterium]
VYTAFMSAEWERFNDRARRILQLGNQAALGTHCNEIRTEHLLLGVLRAGGAGPRILEKFSVDLAVLKSMTIGSLPAESIPDQWRKVPFSALAERVFDYARQEQESLPAKYIGTSHLLLGLLKVEEGGAFKLLHGAGVTYDKARQEVVKDLEAAPRNMRVPRMPPPRMPPPSTPPDRLSEALPIRRNSEPLIEQTKRQIRGMVAAIVELTKQDVKEADFFVAFLERVVACLAAKGGAIWMLGDDGSLELCYQFHLPETFLAELEESAEPHRRLLDEVLAAGIGSLVAPTSGSFESRLGNPTDFLLILGTIKLLGSPQGVVEILQRPGAPPSTQCGYLKFVEQMCALADEYVQHQNKAT